MSYKNPRNPLLAIYKSFIKPHLDHGNVLHDKLKNENIKN